MSTNSRTHLKGFIFALGALGTAGLPPAALGGDLNQLITDLYGGNGITLAATGHEAHFTAETGGALSDFNRQLSRGFGFFPLSSSSGNFAFSFDRDLGTFVNTTETLGPIFAERAPTLGKGKWNISFYGTFFNYDTFNGQSMHDLHVRGVHDLAHPEVGPVGFENDYLDIKLDVDASVRIFSPAATYGITDNWDVSLLIPVVSVDMDVQSYYSLVVSPKNPTPTVHQPGEPQYDRKSGNDTGIGDIVLGTKYQFYKGGPVDLAGAFLAQFATGDVNNYQGTGDNLLRPFLVASHTFRNLGDSPISLTPHLNIGYQWDVENSNRSAFEYVAGFDVGPRQVSLANELLGSHNQLGEDRIDYAVGLKWNFYKRLVVAGNVILPLNDTGVRSDVITTLGLSVSF